LEDSSVVWSRGEIGTGGTEITSPEGEEIQMGESGEFSFEARAPDEPGDYAWTTTQTYKDGSTVEWSGPTDSASPAPTVRVV
jgi:uncharacterized protein YcnI